MMVDSLSLTYSYINLALAIITRLSKSSPPGQLRGK